MLSKKSLIRITFIISQMPLIASAITTQGSVPQLKKNNSVIASNSKNIKALVNNSIIITEYVEGTLNNKAVEISNVGTEPVDMETNNYRLEFFLNGSATESIIHQILLTGILNPGKSYVVYNAGASADFQFPNQGTESLLVFNGDDSIVLSKNGVAVDIFGRVGEDPGNEWLDVNNSSFSSKNRTLRRLNSVIVGDNIVDDLFPGEVNQWLVFDMNTSDGLGCPGESVCPPTPEVNYNVIKVKTGKVLILPTQ